MSNLGIESGQGGIEKYHSVQRSVSFIAVRSKGKEVPTREESGVTAPIGYVRTARRLRPTDTVDAVLQPVNPGIVDGAASKETE